MSLAHIREHDISKEEIRFLESEGKDYCLSHGMIYKDKNENFQHIPFTLLPSPFPEKLFTAARDVQMDFNLLVHKVSQDYHFTKTALLRYCSGRINTISLYQICHLFLSLKYLYSLSSFLHSCLIFHCFFKTHSLPEHKNNPTKKTTMYGWNKYP